MSRGASDLKGRVNRLRVFRYVKQAMEQSSRCPTATEVAQEIGLSEGSVRRHMDALERAAGLPFPIPSGARRIGAASASRENQYLAVRKAGAMRLSRRVDAGGPVEVDILIQGGRL
jgi:DNA-binding transcriptional ArsR family regulator